jgi:toxin HigB-1
MNIRSVRHRGLRRLLERDDPREIRGDLAGRVRHVLTALLAANDVQQLSGPPGWRIHQLTGDREGIWSISVSGNWRITFAVADAEVYELDLEDYH